MSLQIPVEQIRPSPYQPRQSFELDDILGSIQRDGIDVPLTVRRVKDYYELIDGERRLRVAKQLGMKTVPCDVIVASDEKARRMVWKVNTLRKDYTPKEKATYFKKLQDDGMSIDGIAKECDQARATVYAYLNVFRLPSEYQEMIWGHVIPIGIVQELNPLFNGVYVHTPESSPAIFSILDRAKSEKGFDFIQARETIKPYLAKMRREQVEAAKEAVAKIDSRPVEIKTPNDLDKAARALRAEAKKQREASKTSEEIEAEKAERKRKEKERWDRIEEARKVAEEARRRDIEEEAKKQVITQKVTHDPKFVEKVVDAARREAAKKIQPSIQKAVIESDISPKVIEALATIKDAKTQEATMKEIGWRAMNESSALAFIERTKQGPLILHTGRIDEAQNVIDGLNKIYENIFLLGIGHYMIVREANRLGEWNTILKKCENKIIELEVIRVE